MQGRRVKTDHECATERKLAKNARQPSGVRREETRGDRSVGATGRAAKKQKQVQDCAVPYRDVRRKGSDASWCAVPVLMSTLSG